MNESRGIKSATSPSAAAPRLAAVLTRFFVVLAIAAALAACSSAGAASAPSASNVPEHASPTDAAPTTSASTVAEDALERERRLLPIFDLLSVLPGFQVGGLTPEGDEVLVYWKGTFGPEAQAVVEEANRGGIVVNVVSVAYSYDELRKIAGPLVEALAAKGIETEGYTIGDPFDTITVWGRDLDESVDARRVAEDTAADLLPSDLKLAIITSPGPVTPVLLPAVVANPTSRP